MPQDARALSGLGGFWESGVLAYGLKPLRLNRKVANSRNRKGGGHAPEDLGYQNASSASD